MGETTEVIIIGGGVIGLSAAWRLRQAGVKVTLYERGECGREASWAAVGVLSPGNPNFKHALAQLQLDSLDMYPGFCAELLNATGIDPEYGRCERIELCDDEQRYRMGLSEVRAASDRRMPDGSPVLEMLTPEQTTKLEPAVQPPKFGALLCRLSAQVRNPRLLQALRKAVTSAGVDVREHTQVSGLLWEGEWVVGVRAAGEEQRADTVVLAGGAWSRQIEPRIADLVPVHPVRGQALLLDMDDPPFHRIVRRAKCYVVRRRDGKVLIGSTEEPEAGFQIRNTPAGVQALTNAALDMLPILAEARVQACWSGLRPGTPDGRPFIGRVPGAAGLIAACGHFKTGLCLAPITARIVTELVTTGSTPFDLARAAPGRLMEPARASQRP